MSADYNGKELVLGRTYALTALPGRGHVFKQWRVNGQPQLPPNPRLLFTMAPGMELEAEFIPNPFPAVAGIYNGLLQASNDPMPENGDEFYRNTGFAAVVVGATGSFTGSLALEGRRIPLRGKFNGLGQAALNLKRADQTDLAMTLELDFATQKLTCGLAESGSMRVLTMKSGRGSFTGRGAEVHPLNMARYTAALHAPPEGAVTGSGYALLIVNSQGQVAVRGKTADGAAFTQSVRLVPPFEDGESGTWALPMFTQLYPKAIGLLAGNLVVPEAASDPLSGKVDWYRPPVVPGSRILQGVGYYGELEVVGGRYVPPARGVSYLRGTPHTEAFSLLLEGRAYSRRVIGVWPANNMPKLIKAPRGWAFTYTVTTGLLRGTATVTIDGRAVRVNFEGVVLPEGLEEGARGAGYSAAPSQIGKFEMQFAESVVE